MAKRNGNRDGSPSTSHELNIDAVASPTPAFPFMKLPAELRLQIYKYAIQNTIDAVLARPLPTSSDRKKIWNTCPAFIGAQALLHTSSEVRAEI